MGRTFAEGLEAETVSRVDRVADEVTRALSSTEGFDEFRKNFGSVGEAVDELDRRIDFLTTQTLTRLDEKGNEVDIPYFGPGGGWTDARAAVKQLSEHFLEVERQEISLAATQDRLQQELRDTTAEFDRLIRLTRDRDAFGGLADKLGDTGAAFDQLHTQIRDFGSALGHSDGEIQGFIDDLDRTRVSVDNARESIKELGDEPDKQTGTWKRFGEVLAKPWTALDNDVRLVIGLIAGAAGEIASLGSAAGAGLVAVGAAGAQAVVGLGGFVAVFSALGQDLKDLPPDMRDVAAEFDHFKGILGGVRDIIASSAFDEMGGVFTDLEGSVAALVPAFDKLGTAVGTIFGDFAEAMEPGGDALNEINRLILNAADNLGPLAGIAGTFGLALLRAFNNAEPLVQDLLGWLDRVVTTFDDFTRSSNFDRWVSNAQTIFGSLGTLVDEVGRALNDLASPAAVQQTADLLDNLSGFIPVLGDILGVIGTLDPLGLIAQALNDVGAALTPLLPDLEALAEALNNALGNGVIPIIAGAVGVLATAIDTLVDAVGPDGLANALVAAAAGFVLFKGVQGVLGAVSAIQTFGKEALTAETRAASLGATLKGTLGKAGLIGASIVGVLALSEGLKDLYEASINLEGTTRAAVEGNKSITESYEEFGKSVFGVQTPLTDTQTALDNLTGDLDGAQGKLGSLGNAFKAGGDQANALSQTLDRLDEPLASLAETDLSQATAEFSGWASELGASDDQVLNMLNTMPAFKQALEDAAIAAGGMATDQELVTLALEGSTPAMDAAAETTRNNADAMAELEGKSGDTGEAIDSLADQIRNFGSATLDTREAQRQMEQSLDDLTASIAENGAGLNAHKTEFDLNTEAGRKNQEAVDDVAKSTLEHAAAILEQTGDQKKATEAINKGRDALIEQMTKLLGSKEAARKYVDQLGLVPENIQTAVKVTGTEAAEKQLNTLARDRSAVIKVSVNGPTSSNPFFKEASAAGRITHGPMVSLIGEAGPEAVVPLNRPLSQVDPSVRALSAIAQGKAMPMAAGGIVAPARSFVFAEGAIRIEGDRAPEATATAVLQRIADRVR